MSLRSVLAHRVGKGRRSFNVKMALVGALVAASAWAQPPNIVFIMADDLGKDLLAVYGAEIRIPTPNIDRLAAAGIVFENAYASPLCAVTRAELVTGQYPFNNGIVGHFNLDRTDLFLDPKYVGSFAQPLKRAGYATAMAGKWHGNNISPGDQPRVLRAFGFDEWMVVGSQLSTYVYTHEGAKDVDGFPADMLNDFLLDFIGDNRDRPFFVYYPMDLIHKPLVATPLKPAAESDVDRFIAMTEYVDHLVGRLLRTLDELGLRDHTIVFFSGDNGSYVQKGANAVGQYQTGRLVSGGKATLLEAGVNVPFIVSGGPIAQRGRTAALTDFTDVLPTLADFAGADVPPAYHLDGHSIAPFLRGAASDTPRQWIATAAAVKPTFNVHKGNANIKTVRGRDRTFWSPATVGVVVRDRHFKLWDYPGGPHALFDLRDDPAERTNLWNSTAPEVVAAKRRLLDIRNRLPATVAAPRLDPIDANYGLFAHWRFDQLLDVHGQPHFPDAVGGYDARANAAVRAGRSGKFGGALPASAAPAQAAHFVPFFARTGRNFHFRAHKLLSFTLSAWVLLEDERTSTWHLLTHPWLNASPSASAPNSLLNFSISQEGTLALRLATDSPIQELNSAPLLLASNEWTHVAATWDALDNPCGEAVLYCNGQEVARSCIGNSLLGVPANGLMIGGTQTPATRSALDEVAIWRQALTPAQVAALHRLGTDFGYDAGAVDALFNAPRDYDVVVGGRQWKRIAASAHGDGLVLEVADAPGGGVKIDFGDGIAVQSAPLQR